MKIVNKFFNKLTDGYFIDVDGGDGILNSNTYEYNKHLRWHGICIESDQNVSKIEQNRLGLNCFVYNDYSLKKCLLKSNHNGIIHYMSVKNLTSLDYLHQFAEDEYEIPFKTCHESNWTRQILISTIELQNSNIETELITLMDEKFNLVMFIYESGVFHFVHKIHKDLI
jgi:hypothetical protein